MGQIYQALKQSDHEKLRAVAQLMELGQSALPEETDGAPISSPEPELEQALAQTAIPEGVSEAPPVAAPPTNQYRVERLVIPARTPLFPFDSANQRPAEQYRVLRTNLLQHPLRPKVIGVSSPTPGDGKTVTTINLAATFALKSQANVLIVDADLRSCATSRLLGVDPTPGLPEVLRGRCTLEDAICGLEQFPNLFVLPSHRDTANPAELLESPNWSVAMAELRRRFSIVIVDTTPIGVLADYKITRRACDGVLVVVRPDHTNRVTLARSIDVEKSQILGIVINAFEDWFLWSAPDRHDYYRKYGQDSEGP